MKQKYAFIDRDGTLIYEPQDTFYIDSVENLRVLPGMAEYLRRLSQEGYKLVMITNQDHLGKASNPLHIFEKVQDELTKQLEAQGVVFDQVLVCPHGPTEGCACRKPKTGLVRHIKDIDKTNSIVVGDRHTDMQFAKNLGVEGIEIKVNEGIKA